MKASFLFLAIIAFYANSISAVVSFSVDNSSVPSNLSCDETFTIKVPYIEIVGTKRVSIKSVQMVSSSMYIKLIKSGIIATGVHFLSPGEKVADFNGEPFVFTAQATGNTPSFSQLQKYSVKVSYEVENDNPGAQESPSYTLNYLCYAGPEPDGTVDLDFLDVPSSNVKIPWNSNSVNFNMSGRYEINGSNPDVCEIDSTVFYLNGNRISKKSGDGTHSISVPVSSAGSHDVRFRAYYSGCEGESNPNSYTSKTETVNVVKEGEPIPTLDRTSVSFPDVTEGQYVSETQTVKLTNTGEAQLKISSIESDVPWVNPSLDKTTLNQNESATIKLSTILSELSKLPVGNNSGVTSITTNNGVKNINTSILFKNAPINWADYIKFGNFIFSDEHSKEDSTAKGFSISIPITNNFPTAINEYLSRCTFSNYDETHIIMKFREPILNGTKIYPIATVSNISNSVEMDNLTFCITSIENQVTNICTTISISSHYCINSKNRPFNAKIDAYSFRNNGGITISDYFHWLTDIVVDFDPILDTYIPIFCSIIAKGGFCHGFASSAGMYYIDNNRKPIPWVNNNTSDFSKDDWSVKKNIIAYQVSQLFQWSKVTNPKTDLSELFTSIESSIKIGKPEVLALSNLNNASHSVTVFKTIKDKTNNIGHVFVYENRNISPYNIRVGTINISSNLLDIVNYHNANDLEIIPPMSIETYNDYLHNLLADFKDNLFKSNKKAYVASCPVEMLLIDNEGKRLGYDNSVFFNEIENASSDEYIEDSIGLRKAMVYYIPASTQVSANIYGLDSGEMTFQIIEPISNSEISIHNFKNLSVKKNYVFRSYGNDSLLLDINNDGVNDSVYSIKNDITHSQNKALIIVDKKNYLLYRGKSQIVFSFYSSQANIVKTKLFSINGRLIHVQNELIVKPGRNHVYLKNVHISTGAYILQAQIGNRMLSTKILAK